MLSDISLITHQPLKAKFFKGWFFTRTTRMDLIEMRCYSVPEYAIIQKTYTQERYICMI